MKIWICIPVFNRKAFTLQCLASLKRQQFTDFTVVICDHGSTDGTSEAIKVQYPETIVINGDSSLWWTGAINRCVAYVLQRAEANDLVLTLNNDTELPEYYLANLVKNHQRYPQAILTSIIHDIKTGLRVATGYRQNWLTAKPIPVNVNTDCLAQDSNIVPLTHASGRGTLIAADIFRKLGLYDEEYLPHYGADYDFTFRAARNNIPIYLCLDCIVLSYVEETGMTKVLNRLSWKSFIDYFTSMRSPANIRVRFWYGWNNCPKPLLPFYWFFDFIRILGGYFKSFLRG